MISLKLIPQQVQILLPQIKETNNPTCIICNYYGVSEGNSNQEVFFKKGDLKGSFPKNSY